DLRLIQTKPHFHADLYVYWFSIFQGRLEAPLFYCFHCLRIKTKSKPTNDSNISRMSLCIHDQPKDAGTLRPCSACFLGVFGIRCRDRLRRRNTAAYFKHATADTPAP